MELIATATARSSADPQTVWERLIDGRRWAEWSPASEWMVVEGELAAGGYVTIKRKRARQTAYRIERAEPGRRLALLLTFGPMAELRLEWTLEVDGSGSLIRQTIESGGPLRRWFSDPLARRAAERFAEDPVRLAEQAGAGVGTSVR